MDGLEGCLDGVVKLYAEVVGFVFCEGYGIFVGVGIGEIPTTTFDNMEEVDKPFVNVNPNELSEVRAAIAYKVYKGTCIVVGHFYFVCEMEEGIVNHRPVSKKALSPPVEIIIATNDAYLNMSIHVGDPAIEEELPESSRECPCDDHDSNPDHNTKTEEEIATFLTKEVAEAQSKKCCDSHRYLPILVRLLQAE